MEYMVRPENIARDTVTQRPTRFTYKDLRENTGLSIDYIIQIAHRYRSILKVHVKTTTSWT